MCMCVCVCVSLYLCLCLVPQSPDRLLVSMCFPLARLLATPHCCWLTETTDAATTHSLSTLYCCWLTVATGIATTTPHLSLILLLIGCDNSHCNNYIIVSQQQCCWWPQQLHTRQQHCCRLIMTTKAATTSHSSTKLHWLTGTTWIWTKILNCMDIRSISAHLPHLPLPKMCSIHIAVLELNTSHRYY